MDVPGLDGTALMRTWVASFISTVPLRPSTSVHNHYHWTESLVFPPLLTTDWSTDPNHPLELICFHVHVHVFSIVVVIIHP